MIYDEYGIIGLDYRGGGAILSLNGHSSPDTIYLTGYDVLWFKKFIDLKRLGYIRSVLNERREPQAVNMELLHELNEKSKTERFLSRDDAVRVPQGTAKINLWFEERVLLELDTNPKVAFEWFQKRFTLTAEEIQDWKERIQEYAEE